MTPTEYRKHCREAHSQNHTPRGPETVGEYRQAIKQATRVYCVPRFGCAECYIRIAKVDAAVLVEGVEPEATAEEMQMYTATTFGYWVPDAPTEFVIG